MPSNLQRHRLSADVPVPYFSEKTDEILGGTFQTPLTIFAFGSAFLLTAGKEPPMLLSQSELRHSPCFTPLTKINSKEVEDLNIMPQSKKLVE